MIRLTNIIKTENNTAETIGKKLLVITSLLMTSSMLSSCSIYSSGFNCPDSKGARCVMLSQVDNMIDSGEIETIYLDKQCKNGKCKEIANVPKRRLQQVHKVKIEPMGDKIEDVIDEGDNLYLQ